MRESKDFNIHSPNYGPRGKPFFENQKVGVHFVADMLPKVLFSYLVIIIPGVNMSHAEYLLDPPNVCSM